MPATTLIQNLYAGSPEEHDVAIAEALAKDESFPAETPIREHTQSNCAFVKRSGSKHEHTTSVC